MNRRELEEYLREHGCEFERHGGRHDHWVNPAARTTAPVPRHRFVKRNVVRAICRQLGVPLPDGF